MNTHTSNTLLPLVIQECERQRQRWLDIFAPPGTLLPATVVDGIVQIPLRYNNKYFSKVVAGCQDLLYNLEAIGLNGCNTTQWNSEIKNYFRLRLGGNLGERSPLTGCEFKIGNCAEQHAANTVMNDLEARGLDRDINNLGFTPAYRPRTITMIPYCINCQTLFR